MDWSFRAPSLLIQIKESQPSVGICHSMAQNWLCTSGIVKDSFTALSSNSILLVRICVWKCLRVFVNNQQFTCYRERSFAIWSYGTTIAIYSLIQILGVIPFNLINIIVVTGNRELWTQINAIMCINSAFLLVNSTNVYLSLISFHQFK